jgi:hypothetical protein
MNTAMSKADIAELFGVTARSGASVDISKPLKVRWRCRRCNNDLQREVAAAASTDQASPSQP